MVNIIRRASDLPEWFRLAKYAPAESLDSAGWYEQLGVRRDLISLISSRRLNHWQTDEFPLVDNCRRALDLVRENPIVDVSTDDLLRVYFYGGPLHELKSRDPRYSFGVRLATVRDLYVTEGLIKKDERDYARKFFAQTFDRNDDWFKKGFQYQCTDWIDEPVDGITDSASSNVTARVNLLLPDKVLIEQFKRMLKELREPMQKIGNPPPDLRKPDYSSWIKFGVLPYLDLKIWEMESGATIPNRVMADAIFQPGTSGEEVVRKTTSNIARELLTLQFLETLAALAAHEIAEQDAC